MFNEPIPISPSGKRLAAVVFKPETIAGRVETDAMVQARARAMAKLFGPMGWKLYQIEEDYRQYFVWVEDADIKEPRYAEGKL